jgi:hypothetical protein
MAERAGALGATALPHCRRMSVEKQILAIDLTLVAVEGSA